MPRIGYAKPGDQSPLRGSTVNVPDQGAVARGIGEFGEALKRVQDTIKAATTESEVAKGHADTLRILDQEVEAVQAAEEPDKLVQDMPQRLRRRVDGEVLSGLSREAAAEVRNRTQAPVAAAEAQGRGIARGFMVKRLGDNMQDILSHSAVVMGTAPSPSARAIERQSAEQAVTGAIRALAITPEAGRMALRNLDLAAGAARVRHLANTGQFQAAVGALTGPEGQGQDPATLAQLDNYIAQRQAVLLDDLGERISEVASTASKLPSMEAAVRAVDDNMAAYVGGMTAPQAADWRRKALRATVEERVASKLTENAYGAARLEVEAANEHLDAVDKFRLMNQIRVAEDAGKTDVAARLGTRIEAATAFLASKGRLPDDWTTISNLAAGGAYERDVARLQALEPEVNQMLGSPVGQAQDMAQARLSMAQTTDDMASAVLLSRVADAYAKDVRADPFGRGMTLRLIPILPEFDLSKPEVLGQYAGAAARLRLSFGVPVALFPPDALMGLKRTFDSEDLAAQQGVRAAVSGLPKGDVKSATVSQLAIIDPVVAVAMAMPDAVGNEILAGRVIRKGLKAPIDVPARISAWSGMLGNMPRTDYFQHAPGLIGPLLDAAEGVATYRRGTDVVRTSDIQSALTAVLSPTPLFGGAQVIINEPQWSARLMEGALRFATYPIYTQAGNGTPTWIDDLGRPQPLDPADVIRGKFTLIPVSDTDYTLVSGEGGIVVTGTGAPYRLHFPSLMTAFHGGQRRP